MLNVIDEFTHEALAIRVDRKLDSTDVLTDLFILHGAAYSELKSVGETSSAARFEIGRPAVAAFA